MDSRAMLVTIRLCSLIGLIAASPVFAEERSLPALEPFFETLVGSIRPDGYLDRSFFSCTPGMNGISFCNDTRSGVGFRWKAEDFGETIHVPIFLAIGDHATGSSDVISGRVSIQRWADIASLRRQFLSLQNGTPFRNKPGCKTELVSEPDGRGGAAYFGLENPVKQTVVLLMFDGLKGSNSGQRETGIPHDSDYPVAVILLVNDLKQPCKDSG